MSTTAPVPLIVALATDAAFKVSPPEPMVREFVPVLTVTLVIVPAETPKVKLLIE